MNKFLRILPLVLLPFACARADESQLEERVNPTITVNPVEPVDYSQYKCLKLKNNAINLNGDDWSGLAEQFKAAGTDSLFSVVYLGDSHIQADFGGSILRRRLAEASHFAGRGLIIPFKLAGTNQPVDYSMELSGEYRSARLLKAPWAVDMPFTGIGIAPIDSVFTLSLHSDYPASSLRLHHRGPAPEICGVSTEYSLNGNTIALGGHASDLKLNFRADSTTVFSGIDLRSDSYGTLLHSIGNNGATFGDYLGVDGFASELSALDPHLIIIALGTNEAFNRITPEEVVDNARNLIANIRAKMPSAKILLVGPAQCYKRYYRRGRARGLTINTRAATMAKAIRTFAEESGIPYYNMYAVAGNASTQKNEGLLGRDGVHYTAKGYRVMGNLLADALLEKLKIKN